MGPVELGKVGLQSETGDCGPWNSRGGEREGREWGKDTERRIKEGVGARRRVYKREGGKRKVILMYWQGGGGE